MLTNIIPAASHLVFQPSHYTANFDRLNVTNWKPVAAILIISIFGKTVTVILAISSIFPCKLPHGPENNCLPQFLPLA